MGLITFTSIVIAYSAIAVGANNLILTWYPRAANNLLNARTSTAAIIVQKQQGAEYWLVFLVNYEGMGGIRVSDTLTLTKALAIVKANLIDPNVFTYDVSHACYLGTQASPRYGLHFLCNNLIGTKDSFAKAFNLYQQNIHQIEEFEFYYDEELIDFMVKALRNGKYFDFLAYDKLDNE